MITNAFPILDELKVSHDVAYEIWCDGVEMQRAKFESLLKLNNSYEAVETYLKVLQGDRVSCFMRRHIHATQESNHLK